MSHLLTSDKVGLVRGRDGVSAPRGLADSTSDLAKIKDLQAFITAEMSRAFAYGETDCATTADKWVRLVRGFSPMAKFGRQHSGPQDAAQWLSEPGSIAVAVNRVMRAGSFAKTKEPQCGDVGLVFHDGKLCMAICAGDIWFSRDENGFIGAPLGSVWKAWKV